jgi:hypothetical protein
MTGRGGSTSIKNQFFEGISPEVWEFLNGGYQVLDKWLKDRQGRQLSHDDLTHYQQVVVALQKTIELMEKIDNATQNWPVEYYLKNDISFLFPGISDGPEDRDRAAQRRQ